MSWPWQGVKPGRRFRYSQTGCLQNRNTLLSWLVVLVKWFSHSMMQVRSLAVLIIKHLTAFWVCYHLHRNHSFWPGEKRLPTTPAPDLHNFRNESSPKDGKGPEGVTARLSLPGGPEVTEQHFGKKYKGFGLLCGYLRQHLVAGAHSAGGNKREAMKSRPLLSGLALLVLFLPAGESDPLGVYH